MTDKTPHDPLKPGDTPASRRPHATLDLKAVEITDDPEVSSDRTDSSEGAGQDGEAEPAARRSSFALAPTLSHLAAGLAGGILVLLAGDRLVPATGEPSQRLEETAAALERRMAALEAKVPTGAEGSGVTLSETSARMDALAADVAALRTAQTKAADETQALAVKVAAAPDVAALATRLARLEDQLGTIAEASGTPKGEPVADLAALTVKMADLETKVSSDLSSFRASLPPDLLDRVTAAREAGESARTSAIGVDRDLEQIKTDLARLSQKIETMKADGERFDKAVAAAQEETGRVASVLTEVRALLDQQSRTYAKATDVAAVVTPVTGKLSKIESDLDAVLKGESERQATAGRVLVSLELGALKRAVERGGPYAAELEAVRKASGGQITLPALEANKTAGVPPLPALQAEGRAALAAALDTRAEASGSTVWDRLVSGAGSVVRIRKVEPEGTGTGLEAIIARMQSALAQARLPDAVKEASALPPAAQAKIAPWREKVEARLGIDAALAATEKDLKAGLAARTAPTSATPEPGK